MQPITEHDWKAEAGGLAYMIQSIAAAYKQANDYAFTNVSGGKRTDKKTPRRFILFGKRLPFLGGDSEFLRSRILSAEQYVDGPMKTLYVEKTVE